MIMIAFKVEACKLKNNGIYRTGFTSNPHKQKHTGTIILFTENVYINNWNGTYF